MPRQLKPRTRCSNTQTEAQFWGFIRSGLRAKHMKWKPRGDAIRAASRPIPAHRRKGRARLEYKCAKCKGWFSYKQVEADHKKEVGSLNCKEDLPEFVTRLFCEMDGYKVLCKPCHKARTAKQRLKRAAKNGL